MSQRAEDVAGDIIDIPTVMDQLGIAAREAARALAKTTSSQRTQALLRQAEVLMDESASILEANAADMEAGHARGLSAAMLDRLLLDESRIAAMAEGVRAIAALPDPIGHIDDAWDRPNGLHIQRVRVPLGVIGIIYESRPNVTADAGALCLKSGNAVILRGGSESFHSAGAIHDCLLYGLRSAGLPEDAVLRVPTRDRAAPRCSGQGRRL